MPSPSASPGVPGLGVLSFEDARHLVESYASRVPPPSQEPVELLAAAGRVLAEPVLADRDFPPFPRSARDGYAVRAADLTDLPAALKVIAEVRAGAQAHEIPKLIAPGQSAAIMTGAPVPGGADAVVMVEHTSRRGDQVTIERAATSGDNIVPRGAEARQGSFLLGRGQRVNEAAIGLAASVGSSRLFVYARPRVAILATGDELVETGADPGPTQIRNSNTYSLAVQVQQAGAQPVLLPTARDTAASLRHCIEEGLQADLLLITGGVSVGRYDLVEQVLSELHAEFFFTGAEIQPGRPIVFGSGPSSLSVSASTKSVRSSYFFGLPGNPVSTMVTFELFARPMIEALSGQSPRPLRFLHARLKSEIRVKPGLRRFLPALFSGEFANAEVERISWQGSGDLAATARANCYVVVPPDRDHIASGEWIAILPR
jgi:molybdopterin molybdotransferase